MKNQTKTFDYALITVGLWSTIASASKFTLSCLSPAEVLLYASAVSIVALFSTVLWALYWILNSRDKRDPIIGLFIIFICAFPFILLQIFFTEGFRSDGLDGVLGATYIGFFGMGIAFVLWFKALKYTDNSAKTANWIFLAPFASLVFIHFLVGEEIYSSTLIGLVFIMGGQVIQALSKKSKS